MNATTRKSALSALAGMTGIVEVEALVKGMYVSNTQYPNLPSICDGRHFCAVGSLWAGAGHKATESNDFMLPGIAQDDREGFLRHRPGLKAAYEALNTAATQYIEQEGLRRDWFDDCDDEEFTAALESLFEEYDNVGRPELLDVIEIARKDIESR